MQAEPEGSLKGVARGEMRQGRCPSVWPERLRGRGCWAEVGNAPGRAGLRHTVKNLLLDMLRLRRLLEIRVPLPRGQLDACV